MSVVITEAIARKVLQVVDAGLISGIGYPKPGQMCVEAAVNYSLGLPHDDKPPCVSPVLRVFKIVLNDSPWWPSPSARARGLRRLAVAQLGSAGSDFDQKDFAKRLFAFAIQKMLPRMLKTLAPDKYRAEFNCAVSLCEFYNTETVAFSDICTRLYSLSNRLDRYSPEMKEIVRCLELIVHRGAQDQAAQVAHCVGLIARLLGDRVPCGAEASQVRGEFLSFVAESVVQILVEMKAPGCRWLPLTEISSTET